MSSLKLIRTLRCALAGVARPTRIALPRPVLLGCTRLDHTRLASHRNVSVSRQYATSETGDATIQAEAASNKGEHIFNDGKGRSAKEIIGRVACLQLLLARWGIEAALQSGGSGNPHKVVNNSFDNEG